MIVAIDPGKVTGMAVMYADLLHFAGEVAGRMEMYDRIYSGRLVGASAVVIERFTISQRTVQSSPQYDALYLIGAVEAWCYKYDVPLIFQSPGEAKGFGTDKKLKALGWYKATSGGHANDASRHLMVYLAARDPAFAARVAGLVL